MIINDLIIIYNIFYLKKFKTENESSFVRKNVYIGGKIASPPFGRSMVYEWDDAIATVGIVRQAVLRGTAVVHTQPRNAVYYNIMLTFYETYTKSVRTIFNLS